eukprot:1678945-Prymnesium_polylepis.1
MPGCQSEFSVWNGWLWGLAPGGFLVICQLPPRPPSSPRPPALPPLPPRAPQYESWDALIASQRCQTSHYPCQGNSNCTKVDCYLQPGSILTLSSGQVLIGKGRNYGGFEHLRVSSDGEGATIYVAEGHRFFCIKSGRLELHAIKLVGFRLTDYTQCQFSSWGNLVECEAAAGGGAIACASSGDVVLTKSHIINPFSTCSGGALALRDQCS